MPRHGDQAVSDRARHSRAGGAGSRATGTVVHGRCPDELSLDGVGDAGHLHSDGSHEGLAVGTAADRRPRRRCAPAPNGCWCGTVVRLPSKRVDGLQSLRSQPVGRRSEPSNRRGRRGSSAIFVTMTDARWARVKALFQAAIEHPPLERAAFVATAAEDDDELRHEVETLLAADAAGLPIVDRWSLSEPPIRAEPSLLPVATPQLCLSAAVSHVGSYEVISLLGAGAMGEV